MGQFKKITSGGLKSLNCSVHALINLVVAVFFTWHKYLIHLIGEPDGISRWLGFDRRTVVVDAWDRVACHDVWRKLEQTTLPSLLMQQLSHHFSNNSPITLATIKKNAVTLIFNLDRSSPKNFFIDSGQCVDKLRLEFVCRSVCAREEETTKV